MADRLGRRPHHRRCHRSPRRSCSRSSFLFAHSATHWPMREYGILLAATYTAGSGAPYWSGRAVGESDDGVIRLPIPEELTTMSFVVTAECRGASCAAPMTSRASASPASSTHDPSRVSLASAGDVGVTTRPRRTPVIRLITSNQNGAPSMRPSAARAVARGVRHRFAAPRTSPCRGVHPQRLVEHRHAGEFVQRVVDTGADLAIRLGDVVNGF